MLFLLVFEVKQPVEKIDLLLGLDANVNAVLVFSEVPDFTFTSIWTTNTAQVKLNIFRHNKQIKKSK